MRKNMFAEKIHVNEKSNFLEKDHVAVKSHDAEKIYFPKISLLTEDCHGA